MLSFYVAIAYSVVNPVLAVLILSKSRRNVLSKLYGFCVLALCVLGATSYLLENPTVGFPVRPAEQITAFLYSLFPFFFLHFMLIFVRRYEILKSRSIIVATYFAGFFSYVLVLLKLISNPFAAGISQSGYIYYLTWMSILFSIGVALMYSLIGGFSERGMKSNVLFMAFALLMLLLPTPFTQTIFSLVSDKSVTIYFTSSMAALAVLVYIVFRHRIVMNTPYQAMKSALEAMNDLLIKTDLEFRIEMAQGGVLSLLGYSEKELNGKSLSAILKQRGRLDEFREAFLPSKTSTMSVEFEVVSKKKDVLQIDFSFTPIYANEEIVGFVGVGRNITERKRLEAQLRQAQKMEILGTLAGGVAHDFNNLLTIILANAEVIQRSKEGAEKTAKGLEAVISAVRRGAGIVSQLLTFARKTEVVFERMDINKVVTDTMSMVKSTFPKSINVSISLASESLPVKVDANQVSQVLLNLAVNGRDALLEPRIDGSVGGNLTITTKVVRSQDLHSRFLDVADGGYMEITVSDDGIGMDEATKSRIFEPFFSTKEPGKGTGLGLSVVYGVVKSHHGLIDVESERGRGTAFHLLFPADRSAEQSVQDPKLKSKKLLGGGETILIAEDEPMLLETIKTSLQEAGYHVLIARDGDEALRVFNHLGRVPDLVVMDADLPKISGVEAFKLMRAARPATKVIFCTGSIDDTLEKKISGWKGGGVLRKPYSASDLMTRIRMVLDGH